PTCGLRPRGAEGAGRYAAHRRRRAGASAGDVGLGSAGLPGPARRRTWRRLGEGIGQMPQRWSDRAVFAAAFGLTPRSVRTCFTDSPGPIPNTFAIRPASTGARSLTSVLSKKTYTSRPSLTRGAESPIRRAPDGSPPLCHARIFADHASISRGE